MLELNHIKKIYHDGDIEVKALNDVSLTIARGEMVAIMGPSGSGKSTFMNVLGCLDQPTSGSYRLNGQEVAERTQRELATIRNRELGFVFQSFNLLPKLTALQNVELPLVYAGVPAQRRAEMAQQALDRVDLAHRVRHRPKELSGGQQQRVAIARALVNNPRLILADEPTGNLDSHSSVEVMALFQELHRSGITVVLVTHEPDIAEYTQRVIRFRDGQVVADEVIRPKRAEKEVASA
ncbi:putative ABC transport system ATP-binding protein [Hydrogenispora ethanolica]|uniref:Putative ABC transport system ATP-binding protein n=1 Tax=Hydrogenispora ethanolica TaxID=1082276 RepID=A0A4R1QY63_HYDET|nr:ABC transporter ATP-binding protein [Hydrogenispora ethanolica]TCL57704.1 putative ABC transport system ATP-binding protein [Hydrogenispora ethanolica]